MRAQFLSLTLVACALFGCASHTAPPPPDAHIDGRPDPIVDLPSSWGDEPAGVVIWLHGHGGNAAAVRDANAALLTAADARGLVVVWAQATAPTPGGTPAWRGTSSCCWVAANPPDDVGYVAALVDLLKSSEHVDPSRVFVIGSSNGAFLTHAFAIAHGDKVAAVVALKGMTHLDGALHTPVARVPILHAHGTADVQIDYHGGGPWHPALDAYPSVQVGLDRWRATNGTTLVVDGDSWVATQGGHIANETIYTGPDSTEVRKWDIEGADHFIFWTTETYERALDWCIAQAEGTP